MPAEPPDVLVAVFDDEVGATTALARLRADHAGDPLGQVDAAVVVKQGDGTVRTEGEGAGATGRWARRGAVVGGVAAVLFPPGAVAATAAGAAAGAVWGRLRDDDGRLADLDVIGDGLQPGSSAVVAVGDRQLLARLEDTLRDLRGPASTTGAGSA